MPSSCLKSSVSSFLSCRFKYKIRNMAYNTLLTNTSYLYFIPLHYSFATPAPHCSSNPHTIHSLPLLSLSFPADWSHLNSWSLILNTLWCCPATILYFFGPLTQMTIPYLSFSPPTSNTSFLILTLSWLSFPLFHWKCRITQNRPSQSSLHHIRPLQCIYSLYSTFLLTSREELSMLLPKSIPSACTLDLFFSPLHRMSLWQFSPLWMLVSLFALHNPPNTETCYCFSYFKKRVSLLIPSLTLGIVLFLFLFFCKILRYIHYLQFLSFIKFGTHSNRLFLHSRVWTISCYLQILKLSCPCNDRTLNICLIIEWMND